MGGALSKKKQLPRKPRVRKTQVHDYFYEPARKRPRSSQSSRDAKIIMALAQQGRSVTMTKLDNLDDPSESQTTINQPLPRWQSRWEIDMRPDPRDISTTLKAKTTLRPWKSMPLPTTTSKAAADTSNVTPGASRRGRRIRRFSGRRTSLGSSRRTSIGSSRVSLPVPDVDAVERASIASIRIDGFKMLYKTDDITECVLEKTSQLWNYEPKKANKNWFLGNTFHTKTETPPNEVVIPRKMKPYTSIIRTVQRQFVRKPTTIVESIAEED